MRPLIAFCGYAGAGKDEAAAPLLALHYKRHNFGDIIKKQLDQVVWNAFGFSAFTEDRAQKAMIRRTLESWGEDNYRNIFDQFFRTLPPYAVNTRLVRVDEAVEWKKRGGLIVYIHRPGVYAESDWSAYRMEELMETDVIDARIENNGTPAELHRKVMEVANA